MASTARLDELKKKFDENPRRYFAPLANEHRKSGDLDQAIALCRTHLPLQPAHISGHIVLAQALFEAGSLDESREIFHSALGLDPENLIALRYLGDIARDTSDVETARSWYQRVLEVDPRNDEIVQLVRELDAPRSTPVEPIVEQVAETPSAFAPPPAVAASTADAAPATPVDDDARFAPVSLDEVDLNDSYATAEAADALTPNADTPPPAHDTYDAHAAWSIGEPTDEFPMLDTPGLDPFDLDSSSGVDALFDNPAPEADDFFLSELSGARSTADGAEPESYGAEDSWTASTTDELTAAAESTGEETTSFEEGAFYLESPPPDALVAESNEYASTSEPQLESTPSPDATSEQVTLPGMDAFAAESGVPVEEMATGSFDAIPDELPNAEPIEHYAGDADASAPYADPMLGHVPGMSSSEPIGTPASFVTETMAELYLQQGFRNEALAVYRELLARSPDDPSLRDRIEQIENGSMSSIGMASVSEDVVESALRRQTGRPPRSVRSFFASLASRRAPAPREYAANESADMAMAQPADATSAQPDAFEMGDLSPAAELVSAPEPVAEPASAARPDRITPLMSAAESLANFDPFGDAAGELDTGSSAASAAGPAPNVAAVSAENAAFASRHTPIATSAQTPMASPVVSPEPAARRSLEELFPDTPIAPRTEVAAQTLATAFGRQEPQGRPTRAASNELSLDHVFRGAPEGAPAGDGGGFSFDQFFSDTRTSAGDAAAPAAHAPDTGRNTAASDAHDIEQFTAWLEGLKKK